MPSSYAVSGTVDCEAACVCFVHAETMRHTLFSFILLGLCEIGDFL